MRKSNILSIPIILFFASPYLVLFIYFAFASGFNLNLSSDFQEAFNFTLLQALTSSFIATLLGVAGSFGLLGLKSVFLRWFVLLPSAVPVLFVILSALNLVPSLSGFWGIVILHSMINIGLVAVAFESILIEKVGSYLELARVEGASLSRMIFKIIIPVLKKEIILIWLSIFAFCFTSFAVPLIIGGSRSTTIEVLIYELIRVDSNWADASIIAGLQSLFILVLTFAIVRTETEFTSRSVRLSFLGIKPLSILIFFPSVVLVVGLLVELVPGFSQLFREIPLSELATLAKNSFVISILTSVLCLALLVAIAIAQPVGATRKIILGFLAPSSILTGFALLIIWRDVGAASFVKISVGLTLLFTPILYRLGWDAKLLQLRGQIQTASSLGASRFLIFKKILWPQLQPTAAKLSALAAFWAWGDFALSKMVAERTLSVALLVQSLMGSYRLNSATALVWLMLVGSGITYFIVWSLVNVASRKPPH